MQKTRILNKGTGEREEGTGVRVQGRETRGQGKEAVCSYQLTVYRAAGNCKPKTDSCS